MFASKRLKGLLALNLALLVVLVAVTWAPGIATAGSARGAAPVGDFIMVGGQLNGATSNAVYVLDQRNGALAGFLYDRSAKQLKGIQIRNIGDDARRYQPGR
ncbi:MAG: hypothetical protein D8M59_07830 [Planctomycetes bacterium]|nr:hypothetical protein [Planctomycetota bacterium]NOG53233.1 hypothetical protein [Planctomycetota bacterium]